MSSKAQTLALGYDFAESFDPRITGFLANKGAIWRYAPVLGAPELLQKQDNGFSTNWTPVGGGGGGNTIIVEDEGIVVDPAATTLNFVGAGVTATPGAPGTVDVTIPGASIVGALGEMAFFNAITGVLDSFDGSAVNNTVRNIFFGTNGGAAPLNTATNSLMFGLTSALGQFQSSENGSLVFGEALTSGVLAATAGGVVASGLLAHGRVLGAGSILLAAGHGAHAHGSITVAGGNITATEGSTAFGVSNGGTITGAGQGMGFGVVDGTSLIQSGGRGSLACGWGQGTGQIFATGNGSHAHGTGNNATLSATGEGAFAHGGANGGNITASGGGSFAGGSVAGAGSIVVSGGGAFAHASALAAVSVSGEAAAVFINSDGGPVTASGAGAFITGSYQGGLGGLNATGAGTVIHAFKTGGGGSITASGNGAFMVVMESGINETASCTADGGTVFGQAIDNTTFRGFFVGRYAEAPPNNPLVWVATDPLFVVANGATSVARSNAFEIAKDGRSRQTAAERHRGRVLSAAADAISARTDYMLTCQHAGAAQTVTLPAGEEGLTFELANTSTTATVTIATTGGDLINPDFVTMAPRVAAVMSSRKFWFEVSTVTWRAISVVN